MPKIEIGRGSEDQSWERKADTGARVEGIRRGRGGCKGREDRVEERREGEGRTQERGSEGARGKKENGKTQGSDKQQE